MKSSPHTSPLDEQRARVPREPEEIALQEIEEFRRLSFAERGRLLAIACRAAARLDRSRREAGLPAPVPEPWPESTWEFLRQQTARYHARTGSDGTK